MVVEEDVSRGAHVTADGPAHPALFRALAPDRLPDVIRGQLYRTPILSPSQYACAANRLKQFKRTSGFGRALGIALRHEP